MANFIKEKALALIAFSVVSLMTLGIATSPISAEEMFFSEDDFGTTTDDWGWDDDWLNDTSYDYEYNTTTDLSGAEAAAAIGIILGIWAIVLLPVYIYFALTLMVTAKKLDVSNAWFAWIPILNLILMFRCAGLSPWLFLLFFVPLANLIVMIFAYMKIAERRGFESWLGILMIVPIANIIIPGYLAWGEPPKKAS